MKHIAPIGLVFSILLLQVWAKGEVQEPGFLRIEEPNSFHALLDRPHVRKLDGTWRFKTDSLAIGEQEKWFAKEIHDREVVVPSSWEMAFDDLRNYRGVAWYERDFTAPPEWHDWRIALVFSSVHYHPKIWVNGEFAGEHEGGMLPFSIDISRLVKSGAPNRITVKVTAPEDISEFLSGLQQHQVYKVSGIWRGVWLEATRPTFISDLHVISDIDASTAQVEVEVTAPASSGARDMRLRTILEGPDGRRIEEERAIILPKSDKPFSARATVVTAIDRPALWSIENPQLYRVTATLLDSKQGVDAASTHFGMRKIDTEGVRLRLNNKPIFLRGALAISDAPDRNHFLASYHPPSDEEIGEELRLAKELGFNLLRIPLHIEDSRYYDWADRLGIFLYAEPPYFTRETEAAMKRWMRTFEGMVRRDRNHPSVLLWGFFNESSMADKSESEVRAIVKSATDIVARLDPRALVVGNSGGWDDYFLYFNPSYLRQDLEDVHIYAAGGPDAHYLPPAHLRNYSNLPKSHKPMLISELGGYLFMENPRQIERSAGGAMPWTLKLVPWTWEKVAPVNGYEERFKQWGLDKIFGSLDSLVERSDWAAYRNMIKYDLEQLRKIDHVSGYVISQWNNFGPIPHGIMDYNRQPRAFYPALTELQRPDLVLIDWKELNFWSGDSFVAALMMSHYSGRPIENAVARWHLEGFGLKGEIANLSLTEAGVSTIGEIRFTAPDVERSTKARLVAEVWADGRLVTQNNQDIFIYPRKFQEAPTPRTFNVYKVPPMGFRSPESIAFWREGEVIITPAGAPAYTMNHGLDPNIPVTVAGSFDEQIENYLANGGTVLLLVKDSSSLKADLGLRVGLGGFMWYGGGFHCYRYINPASGLFERIPYDNPIGWTFYKILTRQAIGGLSADNKDDVLAGAYGPWLRTNVKAGRERPEDVEEIIGLIVQFKYKSGRLLLTTFDRLGSYLEDPVATIVFQDLLEYSFSSFEPKSALPLRKSALVPK